jgi:hypothetical protein
MLPIHRAHVTGHRLRFGSRCPALGLDAVRSPPSNAVAQANFAPPIDERGRRVELFARVV